VAALQKVIQDAFVASLSNIHPNAPQTQRCLLKLDPYDRAIHNTHIKTVYFYEQFFQTPKQHQ
jgi:hypothetical protein